ncbi:MAG: zinc ribbon domain-containing protein [Candidatus Brocadiia bacterium]
MADTVLRCPYCKQVIELPRDAEGAVFHCPRCRGPMTVPRPVAAPAPPPRPPQQMVEGTVFCHKCGARNPETNAFCAGCGTGLRGQVVQQPIVANRSEMRMLLPVDRSPWAILAGYLGLCSVLLFPAPFAILTGILAIRDIRRNPEKIGMVRAVFGIAAGSLMTIVLIIVIIAKLS